MNYLSVMESFYTFMHPIERIFDHMWLVLLTSTRVLGSNMNRDVRKGERERERERGEKT